MRILSNKNAGKMPFTSVSQCLRGLFLLLLLLPMAAMAQTEPYIITGSGYPTATKGGVRVGNGTIQAVIDAIKADAAGADVSIQFGDGTDELDVGTNRGIIFDGGDAGADWGKITLSGKITANYTYTYNGGNDFTYNFIHIINGVSIESSADIINTNGSSSYSIYNDGTGTVSIVGGTITGSYYKIGNNSTGTVNISGGTITGEIRNNSTGSLNISGGTTGNISNQSTGKITVSGTAYITSSNSLYGTINLANSGTDTDVRLEIKGGTVEQTNSSAGFAVNNQSTGAVIISGGTILNAGNNRSDARTVSNNSTGSITISGGTISSINGYAVYNSSADAEVVLSGAPTIKGSIRMVAAGQLSVDGDFNPAAWQTYRISLTSAANAIAVVNGKDFVDNFIYNSTTWGLVASGNDLVFKNKIAGGAVDAPALASKTHNSITIAAVNAPASGQTVQYAMNVSNAAPISGWQTGLTFSDLAPNTTYYIFARSKENDDYKVGAASAALALYAVIVTNGAGADIHTAGETVQLAANETPAGKRFIEWQITPEVEFLAGTSETDKEIKFEMPAETVKAIAVFEPIPYTITFNSQGGSAVAPQTINYGEKAAAPAAPTRSGYTFAGWYKEAAGTNAWNFDSDAVTGDATLFAKWTSATPTISAAPSIAGIGIQVVGSSIMLTNLPQNAKVNVYNLQGALVNSARALPATSQLSISVQAAGVYIARIGSQSLRVAVK